MSKKPKDLYKMRPKNLEELLYTLMDREKFVITHYYGYFGEEKKSQEAIGKLLEITRARVNTIRKKAHLKLKTSPRNRYFSFLPDDLLIDVFGTDDLDEILDKLLSWRSGYTNLDCKITNLINNQNIQIQRYLNKTERSYDAVLRSYLNLKESIKGSDFNKYLNEINRLSRQLESQCVNFHSALQLAQKLIGDKLNVPETEINNLLAGIGEHLFRLGNIEEDLSKTLLHIKVEVGK